MCLKKITINGVAKGVTTINVTGAATATYKAISKNIAVTVTRTHPLGEVLYESVSSYSGSGDGNELTTNNAYLDYDGWASFTKVYPGKVLSGDADGNLKFGSKDYAGSAVTKPLALAGNATLTYKVQRYDSSNTGNLKVTVTGATATGDVDVEGTAAWVTKTVSITGGTGNVVITFATTDENTRIRVDDIQLVQTTAAATITAAGYATFVAPVAVDFSATSLEVYTAQVNGAKNGVMLNEVASKKVPANTAVILKGETAAGAVIATADALENNDLVAGPVTGDGESHYVLGKEGEKVGFGLLADGTELPANKAYIAASKFAAGAPAFMPFCFGGETTDLSEKVIVNSEKFLSEESVARNATAPVYNLAGQRVMNPSKGLFIMNGKKVAIK